MAIDNADTLSTRRHIQNSIAARIPFFYGWIILPVVLAIQVASSPGQTFGVSIFNPYIRAELGLSHSEISGAYMLGTLLASLPMVYVGSLMDRYGPRRVLAGVVTLFGITCLGVSQVDGLVTVFISFLFLRMLAQGSMGMLTSNAVAMWFNRRLGLAIGIVSTGSALSMGLVPTFSHWLIQAVGWRWAYALLGVGIVCSILPLLAFFFRNRPEDVGQRLDGLPADSLDTPAKSFVEKAHNLAFAMRTRAYWIMAVAVALPAMIITGIHFHAVQIYLDIGMTEIDAVGMFSIFAAAVAGSLLLGGIMADRFRLNLLLSGSFVGISLGIWLLTQINSPWTSAFFAVSLGAGQGIFMSVRSTLWVRYYGRRHLGKIRGTLTTVEVAASSTGPLLMGAAHDLVGSYNDILTVFAAITVPMILVTLFATPPKQTP
ncbi:MAG: MFS transporter [Candidatus Latescibacteria bacterium]|nr:MFS transporter [Candidatus Latescibacterota bacterium]